MIGEGDEVVQLYIRDVIGSVTTYEKNLRGFERVHLKPGEIRRVKFTVQPEDLALYDERHEWVVEPGEFRVMAGASSEDIRLKGSFQVVQAGQQRTVAQQKDYWAAYLSDSKASPTVKNVIDNDSETVWRGVAGEYITLSLKENAEPCQVDIIWANPKRSDVEFEIQLFSGGASSCLFTGESTAVQASNKCPIHFDKNASQRSSHSDHQRRGFHSPCSTERICFELGGGQPSC